MGIRPVCIIEMIRRAPFYADPSDEPSSSTTGHHAGSLFGGGGSRLGVPDPPPPPPRSKSRAALSRRAAASSAHKGVTRFSVFPHCAWDWWSYGSAAGTPPPRLRRAVARMHIHGGR